MAKATRTAMRIRVLAVMKMLLRGRTRTYILEQCALKWNVGDRQADEYIGAAAKEIDEVNLSDAERNLALISTNLWDLYRIHRKKKELSAARTVLLDIAKLRGLDKEELTVHLKRPFKDATDDELIGAIAGAK